MTGKRDGQTGRPNRMTKQDRQLGQSNRKVKLDGRKEWPKRMPKSCDQMRKHIRMLIGQAGHGKVWLTENVYSCQLGVSEWVGTFACTGSVNSNNFLPGTGNSLISGKLVNSKII